MCLSPLHGEWGGQRWALRPSYFVPSSWCPSKTDRKSGAKASQSSYAPQSQGWTENSAQPHTGVLSCITCRSQDSSFPQTHLEGNTRAPQTQPSLALPALLLTHVPPTQSTVLERDGGLLSSLGLHSLAVLPISSKRSQQAGSSSGALPWLDLCYAHVTLWLWQTSGSGLPPLRVTALGGRGGEAGASVVNDPTHGSLRLSVCQASCPPQPWHSC